MPKNGIYPSLIASDILNLEQVIQHIEPYCAGFHLDVMDHHFVPNLTWGPMFINAIRNVSATTLWVDLLVERPETYIPELQLNTRDMVTFHIESKHDPHITDHIHQNGYYAGAGINPETPIDKLTSYLPHVDHVLIMSVHPGFSGQDFVESSIEKLKHLVKLRQQHSYSFTIAMDGGIDANNLTALTQAGADIFSIGSGIFATENPQETTQHLSDLYNTS